MVRRPLGGNAVLPKTLWAVRRIGNFLLLPLNSEALIHTTSLTAALRQWKVLEYAAQP